MKHIIHHHLDVAQTRRVADRALDHYVKRYAKYEPRVQWLDERRAEVAFTAKGVSIRGSVELQPGAVSVDLEVPFLFRAFRGMAVRIIDAELRRVLADHAPTAQTGSMAPPSA
ncbi:MAG TPA: polyhydroxyalkanoic acid system family protein [Polyangiaceae bacterium]|jgi:hypothetical protein|nr:polyhydroxyalkanoic acid system family protein [Polyangiaceae bacterium]